MNNDIPETPAVLPDLSDLPIIPRLAEIAESVRNNPTTVIIGATGSGKTTQVGLYLLQNGFAGDKRIGITQPRRIAATSVASFVSSLYGCEVGQEVGYQIRFDDTTMEGTKLKFMTEGILLQEASVDPLFTKYNVLIFDEAHEQGLNTDIGMGLAKRAMAHRSDLKVIIMSATIDTGRFSEYFDNAPVITVEGRSFPIDTQYLDPREHQIALDQFQEQGEFASLPALAAYKAHLIHMGKVDSVQTTKVESSPIPQTSNLAPHTGHILIFMPGKKEIAQTIEYLELLGHQDLLLLPAHSEMDQAEQQLIFQPSEKRKVVVATNIAETSITVSDLGFVIDSGLIREMTFNHKYGIGALLTIEHSKAGLRQRMGRAGRTRPGTYLPLFTKLEYDTGRPAYLQVGQNKRSDYSTPEIQREDLAGSVLRMSQLGITDLEQFDFMNLPVKGSVHNAMIALKILGALDKDNHITDLGQQMVTLPVEPRIARMILEAQHFGCIEEILTIAACLSTNTVFVRPIGEEVQADASRVSLLDKRGDLFTLLKIIPLYQKQSLEYRKTWADQNYLNHHVLNEILLIQDQLRNLITWLNIPLTSLAEEPKSNLSPTQKPRTKNQRIAGKAYDQRYQIIGQAITSGLLQNMAVKKGDYEYFRADGTSMRIHPGSVWFDRRPPIIVFTEILQINGSTYAVNVQAVEFEWLQQLAPHLIQTKQEPMIHPWKGTEVGQYTITTLNGMEIGRKYAGKQLPQHMIDENRRHEQDGKKKVKGKQKHEHRHRKNIGKRRKPSKPGESWVG